MPKYLVEARYSPDGWRGVIRGGGGTSRVDAVRDLLDGVGGMSWTRRRGPCGTGRREPDPD
jgi:hypothetical protein